MYHPSRRKYCRAAERAPVCRAVTGSPCMKWPGGTTNTACSLVSGCKRTPRLRLPPSGHGISTICLAKARLRAETTAQALSATGKLRRRHVGGNTAAWQASRRSMVCTHARVCLCVCARGTRVCWPFVFRKQCKVTLHHNWCRRIIHHLGWWERWRFKW